MITNSSIKHIIYDVIHTLSIDGIELKYYCQYFVLPGGNWHLSSYRKQDRIRLTTQQKKIARKLLENFEIDLK